MLRFNKSHKTILGIFIIVFAIVCFHFIVTRIVTYYEPMVIELKNISKEDFSKIQVKGLSPFGRNIPIETTNAQNKIEVFNNSILKEITILSSDSLVVDSLTITFSYGYVNKRNKTCVLANVNLQHEILLSHYFKPKKDLILFYYSILKASKILKTIIISGVLLIILSLIIWAFKKSHLNLSSIYSRLRNFRNLKIQIKYLFKYKVIGVVLLVGLCIQIICFHYYAFRSFSFFSGILFISVLWWLSYIIIIKKSNKPKIVVNSVFITLLSVEVLLRIIGINANYMEQRKGFYESAYCVKYPDYWINRNMKSVRNGNDEYIFERNLNSFGYSDREWLEEEMKNKTRILAMGDSFTEGDGTHADSTWLKFLEREFNDTSLYFMNGGICGSDPVFELFKLKNIFIQFKPDVVIICINESDIHDIMVRGGYERFTAKGVKFKKGPWWEPIYAMSYLSRTLFHLKFNKLLISNSTYDEEEENALNTINTTLKSIKQFADKNSITCIFVFHPFKSEIIEDAYTFRDVISIQKACGVNVINLYDYYQTPEIKNNIDDYYWKKDGHHNAKGYELMAKGIYRYLKDSCLIE